MNIVALMGSPRKNSNTDILLDEMIRGAKDNGHSVTKYCISDLDISPCRACGTCMMGKECVLKDDAIQVTRDIAESDGLILATPIYFGQMTGALKVLVDRFYGVTHNPLINMKGKVALLFTHLGPEGYYDSYIDLTMIQPFRMNMHYDIVDVVDVGDLGNVMNQPDKLVEAYDVGKKF